MREKGERKRGIGEGGRGDAEGDVGMDEWREGGSV